MQHESLYAVLGIEERATEKTIQRAFRKKTRKCHPEVNPGDESASALYQTLCLAYAVLGNSKLRSEYDRLGHEEFFHRYPKGEECSEIRQIDESFSEAVSEGFFGDILGIKKRPQAGGHPQKGEDIQHYLAISFLDSIKGREQEIGFSRKVVCHLCGGNGAAPGTEMKSCLSCRGSGISTLNYGPLSTQKECEDCGGRGYVISRTCKSCEGSGMLERKEKTVIKIPAGVFTGAEIRIKGFGNDGQKGGSAGDLVIITRVEDHPDFQRKGDNIYSVIPVMVWEAALGANILIPTVDGKESFSIPPGTQGGDRFKLSGKGVPNIKSGKRGDHFVEIKLVVPAPKDDESQRAYRKLAKLFPENPRVK